jgi:tetratricopeptide (TPR) repeat protein
MKKLVFLFFIIFCKLLFAQKIPSDYFDEGEIYFEKEQYDKALIAFKYIVDNHPKNELYPMAYFNVGFIYFIQKKYEESIIIQKNILKENFNEMEETGKGIMDDPYANYKHRSSEILSDIYFENNKYDSALYYLSLSDTTYPYLHFCGNEYASDDVHKALKYANIFNKLNLPDKAIEKLLPNVFITLANNSKIIEELKVLLTKKKNLKIELDLALSNIYPKEIKNRDYKYTEYFFKFLNIEICVPVKYNDKKKNFDKEKEIKNIKQTEFYKMIEKLN